MLIELCCLHTMTKIITINLGTRLLQQPFAESVGGLTKHFFIMKKIIYSDCYKMMHQKKL